MNREELQAIFRQAREWTDREHASFDRHSEYLVAPGVPTFLESPLVSLSDTIEADAVVLGMPYEGLLSKDPVDYYEPGTAPAPQRDDWYFRAGADRAPGAVRRGSMFYSLRVSNGYFPEYGLALGDKLRIVDAGDVPMTGLEVEDAVELGTAAVETVCRAGAIPLVIGGDHTISWPAVQGIYRAQQQRLGVIVFDSHFDLFGGEPRPWSGSMWPQAMELGALDPKNLVVIGVRGSRNGLLSVKTAELLGVRYYTIPEIDHLGIHEVVQQALERARDGTDAVYMSLDVDVIDPTFCPAEKYPEAGGLTGREVLQGIREVAGSEGGICGFDIACFGAEYDIQYTGSILAARAFVEVLGSLAQRA